MTELNRYEIEKFNLKIMANEYNPHELNRLIENLFDWKKLIEVQLDFE